jgi:hypothetical protein
MRMDSLRFPYFTVLLIATAARGACGGHGGTPGPNVSGTSVISAYSGSVSGNASELKVLVAGGQISGTGPPTAAAEIYDPSLRPIADLR